MAFTKPVLFALALVASVHADHVVQFVNNCPFELTPIYKGGHTDGSAHRGPTIAAGGTGSVTLPEVWESGRIYAQDPKHSCAEPDGGNCTLSECNLGAADANGNLWRQCNISLVSGYNIPTSLSYVGGREDSCSKTFKCLSPTCSSKQAYLTGDGQASCDGCISQCNTSGVGLRIEWCPGGSTIPNMGQKTDTPPPATTKPTTDKPAVTKTDTPKPSPNTTTKSEEPAVPTSSVPSSSLVQSPKKCAHRGTGKRMLKRGKVHFSVHHLKQGSH
ncbi:hypothetical protein BKA62DRAFT_703986 [Auriculariales sp. MPI-PUGE-AT-0066]|nr:hypothetical protein BKA62DRAFT_703986 [Auriculariales sp. MPI-PUGE-AT-0066]